MAESYVGPQYAAYEPPPEVGAAKQKLLRLAFTETDTPVLRAADRFEPKKNIAEEMEEEELRRIGNRVVDDFMVDENSRQPWMARNKEAIDLANQVREQKDFPWENAANIKLPIIADASIKFAARAYSEIIRDNQVVKGKVVGKDPGGEKDARAQRVGQFMSWQLTEKMEEWEEDTDKLLHVLPVVGHLFRKQYYRRSLRRCYSELCLPDKVCVNYAASSLADARRITHILDATHKNTIVEHQRAGVWRDIELSSDEAEGEPEDEEYYDLLEQHRWLDLDKDGYEEPYVVTVHRESKKVLGIVPRFEPDGIRESDSGKIGEIMPVRFFTDYKFIPSFDGGFYYVGFGALLCPLNEVANTIINQLIDAGTAVTAGGGLMSRDIKVKGGVYRYRPREFMRTEASAEQLKNGFFPYPVNEPSATLFNLMGLVLELTQDLASVKDVLAGDTPGANVPATTVLALIEQGMKTFNAIYKRIYRSLRSEFKVLYALNYRYLDEEEYFTVLDEQAVTFRQDFEPESMDVVPVADPYLSSDMQRLSRAEALVGDIGTGAVNPKAALEYKYRAMRLEDSEIEELLTLPDAPNPAAMELEQKAQFEQARTHLKEQELDLRERELTLSESETEAKIVQMLSQAIKNFAEAEAVEPGLQMQQYTTQLQAQLDGIREHRAERQHALAERKQRADEQKAPQAQPAQ